MNIDKLTNADPEQVAHAMMTVLNSLSQFPAEIKLLAVSAVREAMLKPLTTTVSELDLRTVIGNMDSYKYSKTKIAQQTIERMITE